MAAKTKQQQKKERQQPVELDSTELIDIDLGEVSSNTAQSRGMGVLSRLQEMGYGLFEQLKADKKPIWFSLLSEEPEERSLALSLIEQHEPDMIEFADNQKHVGTLQPPGVWRMDDGSLDIIYGARRLVAAAINWCRDESYGRTLTVKVYKFDGTPTHGQLMLLAATENAQRKNESPIDQGLTFTRLIKEEGYTKEQIAEEIGKSIQYVNDRLDLLDPIVKDYRMKVHLGPNVEGGMGMDPVLRLRRRLRKGGGKADVAAPDKGKQRGRLPSSKQLVRYLLTPKKPAKLSNEQWSWLQDLTVREFLVFWLKLSPELMELPTPPDETEDKGKPEKNGKAAAPASPKPKKLVIPRDKAKDLLVSLGVTQARQMKDDTICEKLENIVNLVEDGQKAETPGLQKLLDKVQEAYSKGYKIGLKD